MGDIWMEAGAAADLAEGDKKNLLLNGWPVLICRTDGAVHALVNRCSHAASPLGEGRIRRGTIICPLHGARFELASGKCIGNTYAALKIFAVKDHDGKLIVAVPQNAPPPVSVSTLPM